VKLNNILHNDGKTVVVMGHSIYAAFFDLRAAFDDRPETMFKPVISLVSV